MAESPTEAETAPAAKTPSVGGNLDNGEKTPNAEGAGIDGSETTGGMDDEQKEQKEENSEEKGTEKEEEGRTGGGTRKGRNGSKGDPTRPKPRGRSRRGSDPTTDDQPAGWVVGTSAPAGAAAPVAERRQYRPFRPGS